jgi:hypothetical protein
MLILILSFSYFWTCSGDSLYNGKPEGTIISRDSIFVGNKILKLTEDSDGFISDLAELNGELYYGISDLGLLLRKGKKGILDTIVDKEGVLFSIGTFDNFIVAGLSPLGKLLFIKENEIQDTLKIDAENIYKIQQWNDKLIIGTGPDGKIFEVTKDKKARELYSTEASSVTEIEDFKGKLFVGTSSPGLVYELEKDDEVRIYYDTGLEEVNGLGFCGDTLCISGIKVGNTVPEGEVKFLVINREISVYKGTPITAGVAINNIFYAGESEDGQIGEFHYKKFFIVSDLKESKITALKGVDGNLYIGTGYPANIYRVEREKRIEGKYTSSVFNGGIGVIWGNLFYIGKGEVSFGIRSGKKKEVDSTWTSWRSIDEDINTFDPFIQWRATLKGEDSYLKEVRISFRHRNLRPEITEFNVLPPMIGAGGSMDGSKHGEILMPEERIRLLRMGFYIPEQAYQIPEGIRCIYWNATDPDGDFLTSDLYLKRDEDKDFEKVAENIGNNAYFLDVSPYPDGFYIARIKVTDLPSQPSPLSDERTTRFIIDHTPPDINNIKKNIIGDSISISGIAKDEISSISAVLYNTPTTVTNKKISWMSAFPVDGVFDEKEELFSFKVLRDFKYIAIRVIDRHNNSKVERLEL